jgi:hypothetical protein
MSLSPLPSSAQLLDKAGNLTVAWLSWFSRLFAVASTVNNSGPTAARPVGSAQIPLMIGQMFFDTTLGIPVWIQSLNPTVWVNATGVPV